MEIIMQYLEFSQKIIIYERRYQFAVIKNAEADKIAAFI